MFIGPVQSSDNIPLLRSSAYNSNQRPINISSLTGLVPRHNETRLVQVAAGRAGKQGDCVFQNWCDHGKALADGFG